VARKKKTKQSKKADGEKNPPVEVTPSETSDGAGEKPSVEKEPPKPKKKRARKKAEKKAKGEKGEGGQEKVGEKKGGKKKGGGKKKAAAPPPPPAEEPADEEPAPPDEPTVDAESDVDGPLDPETLVAQVALLDEVAAGEQAAVPVDEPAEAPAPVEDIDAILDDDDAEDLAALIAQTVAGAEPEDHPADETSESLDEGLVAIEPSAEDEDGDRGEAPPVDADAVVTTEPEAAALTAASEEEPAEEIDLTGTIDLGPEITPELRDRLLAQALAHAELQDARYRVPYADLRPAGRWKALVAAGLVLVAGIFAAAPPSWVRPDPPAQLDAAARARALRRALLLQSQQVDAYRVRYQQLPESLDELPQRIPGLRYLRSGNRAYQIIAYEQDGNAIVYDSSSPSPEFGRLARSFEPGDAP
jgi:hypothetical protein